MTDEDERAILIAENMRQREQIAELVAQNSALAARIQELEARLAAFEQFTAQLDDVERKAFSYRAS